MPETNLQHSRQSYTSSAEMTRLSMWTVIGSVAASIATAGILGGASGILQIPSMAVELTNLRAAREITVQQVNELSTRAKALELAADNMQRQVAQMTARQEAIVTRLEAHDHDIRNVMVDMQKSLSEVESRDKDRSAAAMSEVRAEKVEIDAQSERLRSMWDAMRSLRQFVFDLSTRKDNPLSRQSLPGSAEPRSLTPPLDSPLIPNTGKDYRGSQVQSYQDAVLFLEGAD